MGRQDLCHLIQFLLTPVVEKLFQSSRERRENQKKHRLRIQTRGKKQHGGEAGEKCIVQITSAADVLKGVCSVLHKRKQGGYRPGCRDHPPLKRDKVQRDQQQRGEQREKPGESSHGGQVLWKFYTGHTELRKYEAGPLSRRSPCASAYTGSPSAFRNLRFPSALRGPCCLSCLRRLCGRSLPGSAVCSVRYEIQLVLWFWREMLSHTDHLNNISGSFLHFVILQLFTPFCQQTNIG